MPLNEILICIYPKGIPSGYGLKHFCENQRNLRETLTYLHEKELTSYRYFPNLAIK